MLRHALLGMMVGSALVSFGGPALASHTQGGDLLPDLVTLQPSDVSIEWADGERRLRFTNEIANRHTGVLELFPETGDGGDCDGDGAPGNDRLIRQRVYQDSDGNGSFTRGADTEWWGREVGCMVFHGEHEHWHMEDFTLFELRDSSGAVVRGVKTSTCMLDTWRAVDLPGAPDSAYYRYEDCSQHSPQGISVGWVDRYASDLPAQYIVITNVPDGDYCLVSTADPEDRALETNEDNNEASIRLRLAGNAAISFPDEPCPSEGHSAPSPSPDGPAASPVVYDDILRWSNWSWGMSVNPNATSPVHGGSRSMAVTYNEGWAGLSFHAGSFDTSPYTHLQFALHPNGRPLPRLHVALSNSGDDIIQEALVSSYASAADNGWHLVRVPLSALGAIDRTISRMHIQEQTGSPQPTIYLDDIRFIGADDPGGSSSSSGPGDSGDQGDDSAPGGSSPPPSSGATMVYDDSLHWSNWSWSASVNPIVTSPVHAGSRSMSVTFNAAWAGLLLHTSSDFDTSPYSALSFAIRPGGQLLSEIAVSLYDASGALINQVDPQPYAASAGDGWHRVTIPLADLGAANTIITRVQLQEDSGRAQPTFHLDDLGFIR
jgi:hypothetical protein